MKDYHIYSSVTDNISIGLLIKKAAFSRENIRTYYLRDPELLDKVVAIPLAYDPNNKVSTKTIEACVLEILPELNNIGIKTLFVADSKYFQYLTKQNVTSSLGSKHQCKIKGFEHMEVIAGVNYQSLFHNPGSKDMLDIAVNTLVQHVSGYDVSKPKDIIKDGKYLMMDNLASSEQCLEAVNELSKLLDEPELSIDIETAGLRPDIEKSALRFNTNKIVSIAISSSTSKGIAIYFNGFDKAKQVLREFFLQRAKRCEDGIFKRNIYHNSLFDVKNLIYHLFMRDAGDIAGLLLGIKVMTRNIDDTMVMTYLCTNNAQENELGLKENTLSFTGQYAVDVTDVDELPIDQLLEYNLKDVLATKWLYDKRKLELVSEDQEYVYKEIFMKSIPVLLEMMLVGLPINMKRVASAKAQLEVELDEATKNIENQRLVKLFNHLMRRTERKKANAKLKKKVKHISEFQHLTFNPGSGQQRNALLYDLLQLPVFDLTKTKQPASGNKTLVKLKAYAVENGLDESIINLLDSMINYTDVSKILNTFIKAFEMYAFDRGDGTVWLNGDQRLCGTVSGRLGSRAPNLANLPSNSRFGKLVKSCFTAPAGWVFVGADFSALEDRIVAILSGDPMKQLPFLEGVDGHCLNAYGYFKDQMQGIDETNLNDIKDKYPELRQESKAPTFALNYGGTYITLMNNCGFPEAKAKAIEEGHKKLYCKLHAWSAENKIKMIKDGHISCAFGLKVRTPLLGKSMLGDSSMMLEQEFRGANNAKTQSYGLLTTRAGTEFKDRLDISEKRFDILNINFIHDAIYNLARKDVNTIKWLNKHLIECMEWQEESEIKGSPIRLTAELDIGLSWDKMYTLPNNASDEEIQTLLDKL